MCASIKLAQNGFICYNSHMKIREYNDADCQAVSQLFYVTVHAINAKDYTTEQLFAWAKDEAQLQNRRADLLKQYALIAEIDG